VTHRAPNGRCAPFRVDGAHDEGVHAPPEERLETRRFDRQVLLRVAQDQRQVLPGELVLDALDDCAGATGPYAATVDRRLFAGLVLLALAAIAWTAWTVLRLSAPITTY
jgi:hypothetical protein